MWYFHSYFHSFITLLLYLYLCEGTLLTLIFRKHLGKWLKLADTYMTELPITITFTELFRFLCIPNLQVIAF